MKNRKWFSVKNGKVLWNGKTAFYFHQSCGIDIDIYLEIVNDKWRNMSEDERIRFLLNDLTSKEWKEVKNKYETIGSRK